MTAPDNAPVSHGVPSNNVLFIGLMAVASSIGPNCFSRMQKEMLEAAEKEDAAPVAQADPVKAHWEQMTGRDERDAVFAEVAQAVPVASEWISVDERLPDSPKEYVLAHWKGAGDWSGLARYIPSMGWQPLGAMGSEWHVSHWIPLPPAPGATK